MPKTSRPTLSASSISSSRWCMRFTGLSVRPVAGSEIAAAKLSIPICIDVTSPGQLSIRLIGALRRYLIVWRMHFGLTPVRRLSAWFPIFFNVVSRARNSFGLASAKTFLISAACLRKIGAINALPFGVKRYNPDAPILRTLDPAYQASVDEAVDGGADGAR